MAVAEAAGVAGVELVWLFLLPGNARSGSPPATKCKTLLLRAYFAGVAARLDKET